MYIKKELHGKSCLTLAAVICLAMLILPASSGATLLTVDEIIYKTPADPNELSGTVDMSLSGNTLTIELTNTSGLASGVAANNLLTGIGFYLPGGVYISSGSAYMTGSTAINFTYQANVSDEWGYDNDPLDAGPFLNVAYGDVNTAVACMESPTEADTFTSGSIDGTSGLAGPDFGLLSGSVPASTAGGLEAIQDSITISLNLGGTVPGNLVNLIDDGAVVLSFGSPDTSTVPEPATMLLLGSGLIGLAGLGRKKFRKG